MIRSTADIVSTQKSSKSKSNWTSHRDLAFPTCSERGCAPISQHCHHCLHVLSFCGLPDWMENVDVGFIFLFLTICDKHHTWLQAISCSLVHIHLVLHCRLWLHLSARDSVRQPLFSSCLASCQIYVLLMPRFLDLQVFLQRWAKQLVWNASNFDDPMLGRWYLVVCSPQTKHNSIDSHDTLISAIGAAVGTSKAGIGIAGLGTFKPELIMKVRSSGFSCSRIPLFEHV